MLEAQSHACAICERHIELPVGAGGVRAHEAVVDHDHATQTVRGLLCSRCNQGLGAFEDQPERMERAISYLRKGTT